MAPMSRIDYDNRRERFRELMDNACGGKQATIAAQIGREPNYVSRLLSAPETPGHKRLSDAIIGAATSAFGLHCGWFDMPLGTALPVVVSTTSRTFGPDASRPSEGDQPTMTQRKRRPKR